MTNRSFSWFGILAQNWRQSISNSHIFKRQQLESLHPMTLIYNPKLICHHSISSPFSLYKEGQIYQEREDLEWRNSLESSAILHTVLVVKRWGTPFPTLSHGRTTSRVCGSQRQVTNMKLEKSKGKIEKVAIFGCDDRWMAVKARCPYTERVHIFSRIP